jgi:hypothetical protein
MAATGTTSTAATARRNYPPAAGRAVLAEPGALVGLAVLAELEALAELAVLAELEVAIGGSITRRIVAARRMVIATRRTVLAGRLAETRWRTGKPGRGIRSDGRAAIWAATTAEGLAGPAELVVQAEPATAAELVVQAEPVIAEGQASAIGRAEPTASAGGISGIAAPGTAAHSVAEAEDSTEPAPDRTAAVALRAWDRAGAAGRVVAAAVDGAGDPMTTTGAQR